MFCEIDARLAGARGQAEYLKYLGISEDKVIESVGKDTITLKEIYANSQKEERVNQEYASNKVDSDGKIVSISQKAAELIKKSPEWLHKYPVLTLEFKEDGERKSTSELLENAISTQSESIQDIYRKIFESEMEVSLKDVSETLEYISGLLKKEDVNRERIVEFASLIIKNESINSLKNADKENEELKKSISILRKIQTENPDLEISKFIEEKLADFSENGKISNETKKDKTLADKAIEIVLSRKIESMEEFDRVVSDVKKLINEGESWNWNLINGFKKLFEKQFENKSTLDTILMLEKGLEVIPEGNRKDVIYNFIESMPSDMQTEKIEEFVSRICSKYSSIDLAFARDVITRINPQAIEQNPNLGIDAFKAYLAPGEIPFLRLPKNAKELESAISEAQSQNGKYTEIKKGIEQSVLNSAHTR